MALTDTGRNTSLMGTPGPARTAVLILIAVVAVLQLIGAASIDLIVGEAYYLSSARELHLGYFDQPPISLWIIWAAHTLFGSQDPLLLRLPFIAIYAVTGWLVFRIGARYRSDWAGFFAVLVMNIAILFILSVGSWLQPEAPLMLFWLATCWVLMDIFFEDAHKRPYWKWFWVGIWLGLTFLTKYHAVFLVAGAGLYALTNAGARKWIWHPGPYLAVLVAAVVALPVVFWNFQNDWISFNFQGSRAFGDGFHPEWLIRMILGQLLYESPWIALPAFAGVALTLVRGPKGAFPEQTPAGFGWFLVCVAVWPIVFFTAVAAWTDTQFHFHWQAPGYMMLFILLGAWIDAAWARHQTLIKGWLSISAVLTFAILAVLISHTATGWLRHVLPGGMAMQDPTEGAVEWRELGDWFDAQNIGDQNAFVAGLNWTTCGQIDTPLAGRLPLACLAEDPRNIAFNVELADMNGRDAYIVARYHGTDAVIGRFSEFFESMEQVASLQVLRGGYPEVQNLRVIKGTGFAMDRALPVNGQAAVSFTRLPRTELVSVTGTLSNSAGAGTVSLAVDGKVIGTVDIAAHTDTQFVMPIADPDWSVGMREVTLSLEAPAAMDGQVGFTELAVKLD